MCAPRSSQFEDFPTHRPIKFSHFESYQSATIHSISISDFSRFRDLARPTNLIQFLPQSRITNDSQQKNLCTIDCHLSSQDSQEFLTIHNGHSQAVTTSHKCADRAATSYTIYKSQSQDIHSLYAREICQLPLKNIKTETFCQFPN